MAARSEELREIFAECLSTGLPWRIVRLRNLHGLSQMELARRAGVAASTLSQLERGLNRDLQFSTMAKLALFFEVGLDYIAGVEHADLVRAAVVSGRPCAECGSTVGGHSIPDCILAMYKAGRSFAFIAARFEFSLATVETIVRESFRLLGR